MDISYETPDFTNTYDTNFKKLDKINTEINPEISNLLQKLFALDDDFERLEICSQINILNKTDTHLEEVVNTAQGILYRNLKQYAKSEIYFTKAIKNSKEQDPYILQNYVWLLIEAERYDDAAMWNERILLIDKNNVKAWANKGGHFLSQEKYQEAIECCDAAIAIDENHSHAWTNKGNALEGLEEVDKAIECYEKAIAIDADNEVAKTNLQNLLEHQDTSNFSKTKIGKILKKIGVTVFDN